MFGEIFAHSMPDIIKLVDDVAPSCDCASEVCMLADLFLKAIAFFLKCVHNDFSTVFRLVMA
jgi:hypothetical protein